MNEKRNCSTCKNRDAGDPVTLLLCKFCADARMFGDQFFPYYEKAEKPVE